MTRALLDTHTLLWLIEGDPQLGTNAKEIIEAGKIPVFVSSVSLWEIAVKRSIGKLSLSLPFAEFVDQRVLGVGLPVLDIQIDHIIRCADLPLLHRDPFDRLLAAQCLAEKMEFLSRDAQMDAYGVTRVW